MIGRLTGVLAEKTPPQVLIDVQGVGYEVDVPMSSFYNLPALGERVTLLTHFVVREDAQQLFGFLTAAERNTFRQLIKISGIGPRMALGVLSGLSVQELTQAVAQQQAARLVKVPGIGKKTAERLLLELKGKLAPDLGLGGATITSDAQADIVQALIALGYSEKDAAAALKLLPPEVGVSDGIKLAMKALSK
ncbi:Holliday junction branch migration protein RuvA [Pseudaquabacterium pictum]|uniref:Holliday junction branch migration complex subunit RuvA n=1 Tax=Pseudaquabacterium pictum TaxID=2315236 RepID=A0A480AXL8_9BURK|nr:Holliday junction branch migration protein RuvA [Rubrivivax pictus]GCL65690.1 Holliday junction ATP-dependent DNA helicase RuvA [Rubrivivax pictus]